jgi:tripartite ATP-independent transporter DctM subunit
VFGLTWADRTLRLGLLSELTVRVVFALMPPLALIFLVLGTIFLGIATPTEGGAMGATGSVLLAIFKRYIDRNPNRFNLVMLRSAVEATAKLSCFVVFILIGARIFSLTFYGVNGHVWVEHLLLNLPGGQLGFLIFVNIFVFVLAFFLDFFELSFIIVPLLGPVAEKLGIDLIWFGVLLAVNMQTSFMHPPFGFALFYLRAIAPKEVKTRDIYWGSLPWIVLQLMLVGIMIAWPETVTYWIAEHEVLDQEAVDEALEGLTLPEPGGDLGTPDFGEPPPLDLNLE